MNNVRFDPSFFVKKERRISAVNNSTSFVYQNQEAHLIIDGELDLSGINNNTLLHAKKIIVTPRGNVTLENGCLRAEDILIQGKVHANKNIEIDSPSLQLLEGKHNTNWLKLRLQLTSYECENEDKTVKECIEIANRI